MIDINIKLYNEDFHMQIVVIYSFILESFLNKHLFVFR